MKKYIFLILMILFFPVSLWAGGVCTIQSGPPTELIDYINSTNAKLSQIAGVVSKNQCAGNFQTAKKAASGTLATANRLMDQVDIELKLGNSIMLDFQYNLKTSFDGTARTPVINQGIIIHGLEDRIVSLMKTAGNACSLDAPVPSLANQSATLLLKNMLIENRTLEYYFKSVAAGNTNIPASIPRDSALYRAIMENYSPAATSGCTNKYSFEKILSDLSNALSNAFQINGNALDGWKRAIALFSGDTGKTGEYQALQMRLLQGELSRQGLSQTAQSIMLNNLSCYQIESAKGGSVEQLIAAKAKCQAPISGMIGSVGNAMREAFNKDYSKNGTTSDRYQRDTLRRDTQTNIVADIASVWQQIDSTLATVDETATNDQILSDLVSVHVQLVTLNKLLKQKIPAMQTNCMKENTNIPGACRG